MTDLHTRIADAIKQVDDMRVCKLSNADIKFMADAVADDLTKYLPPIFASAIHAYADAELMAMSYHGDPSGLSAMKKLNREAAQIANYATTNEKWNGKKPRTMTDMVAGEMSDKPPMSNIGLRDRIAAVLRGRVACDYHDSYESVADAVIAELGLEKQAHYDPFVSAHRWVTDWQADDE